MRQIRRAIAGALVALTACTSGGASGDPLEATAEKLSELRNGRLNLRFTASTARGPAGFSLSGPFELRSDGPPLARLEYTVISGSRRTTARFESDGKGARIVAGDRSFDVPQDRLEALRVRRNGDDALDVGRWLRSPVVADGGTLDGVPVDRITGQVDVVNVVNSLGGLVGSIGGSSGTTTLDQRNADVIRRSARKATFEILTGRRDRFLRKLAIDIRVTAPAVGALRQALGPYAGVTFRFDVTIARPNATRVPITTTPAR